MECNEGYSREHLEHLAYIWQYTFFSFKVTLPVVNRGIGLLKSSLSCFGNKELQSCAIEAFLTIESPNCASIRINSWNINEF